MIFKLFIIAMLSISLTAKEFTPNDVFVQTTKMADMLHDILKYYNIKDKDKADLVNRKLTIALAKRHNWQLAYEISLKINSIRVRAGLEPIQPINITPHKEIDANLVYEYILRVKNELTIFMLRKDIKINKREELKFKNITVLDVTNKLIHLLMELDQLNNNMVSCSTIHGEQMRVYDDISQILHHLQINDDTIPEQKVKTVLYSDIQINMVVMLKYINYLKAKVGMEIQDFSELYDLKASSVNTLRVTQMIICELQTIKAHIGLTEISMSANFYKFKNLSDNYQLSGWNIRKLKLIKLLRKVQ